MAINAGYNRQWSGPELAEIAVWQKCVCWIILGQLIVLGILLVMRQLSTNPGWISPDAASMLALMLLCFSIIVGVLSVYFVYKLAQAIEAPGLLYVIALFIPYISLLALAQLIISATKLLQSNGVSVKLMGVDKTEIEELRMPVVEL